MHAQFSRRDMLTVGLTSGAGGLLLANQPALAKPASDAVAFRYALNTSTIRGQKLPITQVVDIAARAGYDALEPWIDELAEHVKTGGSLADLGKQIADFGLTVESAIGFSEWIVDDPQRRARGLEDAKRSMDMLAKIGGKRVAASAAGATDVSLDPLVVAGRYRALVELGQSLGVVPEVEVWGGSKTLSRLAEAVFVAVASGCPEACVLPDVFHLYKGGSEVSGLRLLNGQAIPAFHVNDYPAEPARKEIGDDKRVFPGDGVAPLGDIFRNLRDIGFSGVLSLELFNREYWQQDPLAVARTGLEKTKAAVHKALG